MTPGAPTRAAPAYQLSGEPVPDRQYSIGFGCFAGDAEFSLQKFASHPACFKESWDILGLLIVY